MTEDELAPKQVVPKGGEGELWIGGVGVAAGYLHAPDLTKEVCRVCSVESVCTAKSAERVCMCVW